MSEVHCGFTGHNVEGWAKKLSKAFGSGVRRV